jgi:tRNA1Val (adenine37-N6)-methyltransferase
MPHLTIDSVFDGRIQVKQEQDGYRFSIEAVILAYFAGQIPAEKILDLGTGCGIIPLVLAYRDPRVRVVGIEVQPALAELARLNVHENHLADRITILCQDMKDVNQAETSGPVDLVLANPPFYQAHSGRINPNHQRAVARHEIKITLPDVIDAACRMLPQGGMFLAVYSVERMVDMLTEMRRAKLEPRVVRMLQSGKDVPARFFLVEGVKEGKPAIKMPPPLVICREDGSYTDEVAKMFLP